MKTLTSILMTFTIVLCSVVQYHHHDGEGNIVIYSLFGEIEVGICHHSSADGEHSQCHHHHHHDGHCGDSEGCSMHLDQLANQEQQEKFHHEEYALLPALAATLWNLIPKEPLPTIFDWEAAKILPLPVTDPSALLLRGPPAIC